MAGANINGRDLVRDDLGPPETQRRNLLAATSTPVSFTRDMRLLHIKNFDVSNVLLVKSSAISGASDAAADEIGKAISADIANDDWYPGLCRTIYLWSAGASKVSVVAFPPWEGL